MPEIARVLHSGGTLGILWTGLDWQAAFGAAMREVLRDTGERVERRSHQPEDISLPTDAPFGPPEIANLPFRWQISPQRLLGLLGTYSSVFTLPCVHKRHVFTEAQRLLSTDPRFAGQSRISVDMSCRCWRALRL